MSEKFKCGICGQEYEKLSERAECEQRCLKERRLKAEALQKELLAKEQSARQADIQKKYDELIKLIDEYLKDYGRFSLDSHYSSDRVIPISKLIDRFFF